MKVYHCEEPTKKQLLNVESLIDMLSDCTHIDQECVWVLSFTNDCHLIAKDIISMGGFAKTYIDMKVLFKRVLMHNASKMILVHNHPNQSSEPSEADLKLTDHIRTISSSLGLDFMDHIVVGIDKYTSIKSYVKDQNRSII